MEVRNSPTAEQCCTSHAAWGGAYVVGVTFSLNYYYACQSASMSDEGLDQPLAECRGRQKNRQLPKRYRDILPEPPAALPPTPPPAPQQVMSECALNAPPATAPGSPSPQQIPKIDSPRLLKSTRNKFGLFWQYHATCFPDHNSNGNITWQLNGHIHR
jgi:hypothetical protein